MTITRNQSRSGIHGGRNGDDGAQGNTSNQNRQRVPQLASVVIPPPPGGHQEDASDENFQDMVQQSHGSRNVQTSSEEARRREIARGKRRAESKSPVQSSKGRRNSPPSDGGRKKESRKESRPLDADARLRIMEEEMKGLKALLVQISSQLPVGDGGKKSDTSDAARSSPPQPKPDMSIPEKQLDEEWTPFSREIMQREIPGRINIPKIDYYDGTTDPSDYVSHYKTSMALMNRCNEALLCRAFSIKLKDSASVWYHSLGTGSISSFSQLVGLFKERFVASANPERGADYLLSIKQQKGESLRDYITRFGNESARTTNCDPKITALAFRTGLAPGLFRNDVTLRGDFSLSEMLQMSRNYIKLEETRRAEREMEGSRQRSQNPQNSRRRSDDGRSDARKQDPRPHGRRDERPFAGTLDLAASQAEIYKRIKGKLKLEAPAPIKTPVDRRDSKRYCEFHREVGHTTDQCRSLAYELEKLAKQGKLREFQRGGRKRSRTPDRRDRGRGSNRRRSRSKSPSPRGNMGGNSPQIMVVHAASTSKNARKRELEELKRQDKASTSRPRTYEDEEEVKFSARDAEGIKTPHEDALVVSPKIANHRVHRVLVDNGCAINIIYSSCLKKMGIEQKDLKPSKMVMVGFSGEKTESEGQITLSIAVGDGRACKTVQADFQVLGTPSPYNAILGRPWLCQMKAVTSVYHQCLKFSTRGQTVTVRGNQVTARECHAVALK